MTTRNYALDKNNARILGVCAGLARSADWDPALVRIGAVALTLFLLGPLMILFYVIVGAIAASR